MAEVEDLFGGSEIVLWEALRDLAPFGLRGEWVRSALLQALVANVNRDPKVRPQAYTMNDFLPEWLKYDTTNVSLDSMTAYLDSMWK